MMPAMGAARWYARIAAALALATAGAAVAQSSNVLQANATFAPATIQSGEPTNLRVRLENTNDGTINRIAFDVVFAADMRPVGALDADQCDGNVTAIPGGVRVRGAQLGSLDNCIILIGVTVDSDTTREVVQDIGPITSNGGGDVRGVSATLTVIGGIPPKITSPPLPTPGFLENDYLHQVTVTGTAPVTVTAEGLPPGLVYNDATRRVTGKPTLAGMFLVTLRATNGYAPPAAQVSTVEIRNPPLLIVTPPPLSPPLLILAPVSIVVEATGGLKPYIFDLADGALPPGLTLGADGRITGAPTVPGTYVFTVRVRDVLTQFDGQVYELVVQKIATSVRIGLAPNPAVAGQVVVATATVVPQVGAAPPGSVDAWVAGPGTRCPEPFESGSDPVTPLTKNAALAGGVAQIAFPDLAIGRFKVCVRYGGAAQHDASTLGPVDLFVIKGVLLPSPTVSLKVPGKVRAGGRFTGSVVIDAAGTMAKPSGTVRVRAGARDFGEIALADGRAVFEAIAPDDEGTFAITASYAGDGAFSPAVAEPAYVAVMKQLDSEAIPATGGAALAAMALALAGLASRRLRRRR
jgi:hypothetical protein